MHRSQLRAVFLILSLTSGLAGCYTWQPRALPTGDSEARATSARPARVSLITGTTLKLSGVRASGDSLVGQSGAPPLRIAVHRTEVRSVDERRLHLGRTAAAAVGLIAVAFGGLVASAGSIGVAY